MYDSYHWHSSLPDGTSCVWNHTLDMLLIRRKYIQCQRFSQVLSVHSTIVQVNISQDRYSTWTENFFFFLPGSMTFCSFLFHKATITVGSIQVVRKGIFASRNQFSSSHAFDQPADSFQNAFAPSRIGKLLIVLSPWDVFFWLALPGILDLRQYHTPVDNLCRARQRSVRSDISAGNTAAVPPFKTSAECSTMYGTLLPSSC